MEEQKWIRITKKYALIEDENPQEVKSPHTLHWLKVIYRTKYTTSFGNSYPMYNYEVLDAEANPSEIEVGNLVLTSFHDTVVHSREHSIQCYFRHSNGGTWSKEFDCYTFEGVLRKAISYLEKHQSCNSMHELKLSETNESLNKENERHLKRIETLEEKLTLFKGKNEELEKQLAELHEVNKQLQEDLATTKQQLEPGAEQ